MLDAQFLQQQNIGRLQNFSGVITGAAIDSRQIQPGWAFFALRGAKADGHDFVTDAFQRGAVLAVVAKDWAGDSCSHYPLLIVDDPAVALQQLGRQWRRRFRIPVLGITGTNGKTTTRAICNHILRTVFRVHATQGNFNNQLGLPLTLLAMPEDTTFCLLEMGTNHFGEIARLCELAEPNAGLITNVGPGHLEFFGSLDGVARAKAELFAALPPDGVAFINLDDERIKSMSISAQRFTYGFERVRVDLRGKIEQVTAEGRVVLTLNDRYRVLLPVPGTAFAKNALAAAAVGFYYGVTPENILSALENFQPVAQRMVVQKIGDWQLLNDTYNANPGSVMAALETLSGIQTAARRIFVMGDMLELGAEAANWHAQIGDAVAQFNIDLFVGVGAFTAAAIAAAREHRVDARHFDDKKELLAYLKETLRPGDAVLVKGSRGSRMEEIIQGLVG